MEETDQPEKNITERIKRHALRENTEHEHSFCARISNTNEQEHDFFEIVKHEHELFVKYRTRTVAYFLPSPEESASKVESLNDIVTKHELHNLCNVRKTVLRGLKTVPT